jgi:epoxide hydrolase
MPDEVTPFRVEIAEAALGNLRQRLLRTRWAEAEPVADWSQGVPHGYLRELCRYWADGYDWRATGSGSTSSTSARRIPTPSR